ncbi:MAG: asparaginase [Clostridia bacterium]|nr:asparaginase [Clostridia bacterium]MBN2884249.1 asparaginase [Clostridia bacterium]
MKKVLLIATGGTISASATESGLVPRLGTEQLLSYIPETRDFCEIDSMQPLSIDSTNIQPEDWCELAGLIKSRYEAYDGFVITHGTDTMAYAAAMLSYLIQKPGKPIVFTGSQKPINLDISDARMNLRDAFSYAAKGKPGVYIVFNGKVILGTRARKTKSKSYDAFESINFPLAAMIDGKRITQFYNPSPSLEPVKFYTEIFPHIFLLKLSPGMEPDVLDYISDKYEAIVIESYGTGGIPFADKRNFMRKLESATLNGKIIVVATQVMLEGSDLETYEVGSMALKYNVLQAFDMTIEAIICKLMWLMANTKDYDELRKLFYIPVLEDIMTDVS